MRSIKFETEHQARDFFRDTHPEGNKRQEDNFIDTAIGKSYIRHSDLEIAAKEFEVLLNSLISIPVEATVFIIEQKKEIKRLRDREK